MTNRSILAVSGSLRTASYNTAALHAAAHIAPAGITVRVFDGIGDLPLQGTGMALDAILARTDLADALRGALLALADA